MRHRLTRSSYDKVIAGVCGGIAEYYGWDAGKIRLAFVLIGFITAFLPMFPIYVVFGFVI
jgi:phage shock protein C